MSSADASSAAGRRDTAQRAASIAGAWCGRRLGPSYARLVWQLLADAARLGVVRDGRPEAWAAGAIVVVARVNRLLPPAGHGVTAGRVAGELGVSVGALSSTEHALTTALSFGRYRERRSIDGD